MSEMYVRKWRRGLFCYWLERGLGTFLRTGLYVITQYNKSALITIPRRVISLGGNSNGARTHSKNDV